ncbi:fimbria/pilus periplasmic chaperone [Stenotrophomonas sepilia]|uniref:Fimbria/pilus periplasmic chaperone n=1 Tax=Stenotrophomonas sepilia TaxID=2860290 RepID=A0ABQ6QDS2_9GAMM|nr:fimbria/pilus periplasmic chaperone [Stenotrophomonas sepilia]
MNFTHRALLCCALAAPSLLAGFNADARVVVEGNRVIYTEGTKELSVRTQNAGKGPVLVQAWVSAYGARTSPADSDAPFVILPPVVRIDEGKHQVFRLRFLGDDLPADRESVFTLNLAEIPASPVGEAASTAVLNIVLRNRLKLFYRPQSISKLHASDAIEGLRWSVVSEGQRWALEAKNDSPFHVSTVSASVTVNGRSTAASNVDMLRPYGAQRFPLPGTFSAASSGNVTFKYINDHGGVVERTMPLTTH